MALFNFGDAQTVMFRDAASGINPNSVIYSNVSQVMSTLNNSKANIQAAYDQLINSGVDSRVACQALYDAVVVGVEQSVWEYGQINIVEDGYVLPLAGGSFTGQPNSGAATNWNIIATDIPASDIFFLYGVSQMQGYFDSEGELTDFPSSVAVPLTPWAFLYQYTECVGADCPLPNAYDVTRVIRRVTSLNLPEIMAYLLPAACAITPPIAAGGSMSFNPITPDEREENEFLLRASNPPTETVLLFANHTYELLPIGMRGK